MDNYFLITFVNTLNAMNAESVLKEEKINIVVMPTPTFITKSCGLSIKVECESIDYIKEMIKNEKIKVKGIYLKEDNKYSVFMEQK